MVSGPNLFPRRRAGGRETQRGHGPRDRKCEVALGVCTKKKNYEVRKEGRGSGGGELLEGVRREEGKKKQSPIACGKPNRDTTKKVGGRSKNLNTHKKKNGNETEERLRAI